MNSRPNNRAPDQLRPVSIQRDYIKHAEGAVLISMGDTRIICTASIEDRQPPWLRKTEQGWLTAEYGMLPRATGSRNMREAARGKQGGRTVEIQRLIGRSLRAAIDLSLIGPRTITIDCDVIQADGGTRTAAITGGYVALIDALNRLQRAGELKTDPLQAQIAAVSVGVCGGQPVLDLEYSEDVDAETDMNVIMNDAGAFIEVQGTAETLAFSRSELDRMLDLAASGIEQLMATQTQALTG